MNKVNVTDPSEVPCPKSLNVVEISVDDTSEHLKCLICGEEEYEWGHTEGLMLEHYKAGNPTGLLAGKEYIRVRRCLKCNNLQLFHVGLD